MAASGELLLDGITVNRSSSGFAGAILNFGSTTLRDSVITNTIGEAGTINNQGTLKIIRSIIADNDGGHDGGAIVNEPGGNVLIEKSTIAHNFAIGPGGIGNFGGSVVVKNSSIISNSTFCCEAGGGIGNIGGSVTIISSTIAKNVAGFHGGGIYNGGGFVSVTNSTIRENQVVTFLGGHHDAGGGIRNEGGVVQIQNTIVAGNTLLQQFLLAPDCAGTIASLGNNLIGDSADCDINLQPTDLTGDPGLGSLAGAGENDLPGEAHYPVLAGSPVIDAGNRHACPRRDQLGNKRDEICDIGSIEFQKESSAVN